MTTNIHSGDRDVFHQVEQFLFHEADLLDRRDYEAWLDLCSPDINYFIPIGDSDRSLEVGIVNDSFSRLKERVLRLKSGFAYSQEPASKVVHLISNVRIVENSADKITVASNQLIVEVRRSVQNMYAGHYEHDLTPVGDSFQITRKDIHLIESDLALGNLTFLI